MSVGDNIWRVKIYKASRIRQTEVMADEGRELRPRERALIARLLESVQNGQDLADTLESSRVREMNDGGMGSLEFVNRSNSRRSATQIAELQFEDADGVPVTAALNVDRHGALFELDLFKGDFSPLI